MQLHAGLAHPPMFAPAVVPAFRGMAVEVPLPVSAIAADADRLRDALAEFYAGSKVVEVSREAPVDGELLLRGSAGPNDALVLHVFPGAEGIRLIALLDNLGKGASGAAVQSLNLMAGLEETAGLVL